VDGRALHSDGMFVITRTAYLALGSNLGDREAMLDRARGALLSCCTILRDSENLENPAILHEDQPDFLNAVLEVETDLGPAELLSQVKRIEQKLGRTARFRYGPREIDIDILSMEGIQMQTEDLTLPHPGLDRPYLVTLLARLSLTPQDLKRH
jgi:2-amino-4-hydroxy-6-hydroxymethyldihydropteridine diphosphokinase